MESKVDLQGDDGHHSDSTEYDDQKLAEIANLNKLRVSYGILTGQFALVTILFIIEGLTS